MVAEAERSRFRGCVVVLVASRPDQIGSQGSFKLVNSYWHLQAVEWIPHDKFGVDFVAPASHCLGVGLFRAGEEQEFYASGCLEAGKTEMRRLQGLYACGRRCTASW